MSYLGQNSKSSIVCTIQESALKKISQFVAQFYLALLPRANNKDIERDIKEDQDYLLTNLEDTSILHSILAGCLAIDSCLSNIFEKEKSQTDKILCSVTNILSNFLDLQQKVMKQLKDNSTVANEFKNFDQNLRLLAIFTHQLPFGIQSQQVQKQNILWRKTKQNSTIQLSQQLLTQQILKDNTILKQQLSSAEKKITKLQSRLSKNSQEPLAYSNLQKLQEQIYNYKIMIDQMKSQFKRQKNYLNREINRLEDQLRAIDKYDNVDLIMLLEELQDQIDELKTQRRHDERIINNIQQKLQFMTISKQSRMKKSQILPEQYLYEKRESFTPRKSQRMKRSMLNVNQKNVRSYNNLHKKAFQYEMFNNVPLKTSFMKRGDDNYENLEANAANTLSKHRSASSKYENVIIQDIQPNDSFMPKKPQKNVENYSSNGLRGRFKTTAQEQPHSNGKSRRVNRKLLHNLK